MRSNNDPFSQITKSIAVELEQVNKTIIDSAKGKADLIGEITNHLVSSGGKRVRPILTILGTKLCGYDQGNRHCNLAAAVELIHTATLLHDDVVDGSSLRRGKKTANAIWDNKASILVGDYLLSVAFQIMVKDGSLEVLDILSKTSGILSDGEVMQLMNSSDITISEEKYLEIISYKTAVLFAAALQIGAVITNAGTIKQKALADFGNNLGIAFQIIDDVLDYAASEEILGKEIGNDFFEGKITLPIILTYQKASDAEKAKIKDIFFNNLINGTEQKNSQSFAEIMTLIKKYDGLEESTKKALFYKEAAIRNLSAFSDCQEKLMLLSILEYAVSRKH
ncbi:MAG: ispB [Rickettsiaceae bacterium]|nr:ispB [Rickettsiaceae bacterium]